MTTSAPFDPFTPASKKDTCGVSRKTLIGTK